MSVAQAWVLVDTPNCVWNLSGISAPAVKADRMKLGDYICILYEFSFGRISRDSNHAQYAVYVVRAHSADMQRTCPVLHQGKSGIAEMRRPR